MTDRPEPPLCCHYGGGPWVAVVGPRTWLLADIDPAGPALARCWALVDRDAEPADIVAALLRDGFRAVDNFVLARVDDERGHLVVRGTAQAALAAGTEPAVSVRATGLTTWAEHWFDVTGHPAVRLCGPTDTDLPALPLVAGAVAAGWLELSVPNTEARPDPAPAEPVADQRNDTVAEPAEPSRQVAPPEPEVAKFDHMFGATTGPVKPDALPVPPPVVPPATARTEAAETTGMITAMPAWGAGPTAEVTSIRQPSQPATPAPVDPAATVNRAALRAATRQHQGGPTVQAVTCTVGHLSPAHASACRVCGIALGVQQPAVVPRPTLGTLRLSTGEDIPLDRGVLLGRAPKTENESGPGRPHVLRLGGASEDVSRNHVEITLEDWSVLVTDLDSTNGTVITAPGRAPERLRANVPQAIEPGTVVSLADEITLRFEVSG